MERQKVGFRKLFMCAAYRWRVIYNWRAVRNLVQIDKGTVKPEKLEILTAKAIYKKYVKARWSLEVEAFLRTINEIQQ